MNYVDPAGGALGYAMAHMLWHMSRYVLWLLMTGLVVLGSCWCGSQAICAARRWARPGLRRPNPQGWLDARNEQSSWDVDRPAPRPGTGQRAARPHAADDLAWRGAAATNADPVCAEASRGIAQIEAFLAARCPAPGKEPGVNDT